MENSRTSVNYVQVIPEKVPLAVSLELYDEPSGSAKGEEFRDWLRNYQLIQRVCSVNLIVLVRLKRSGWHLGSPLR